MNPEQQRQLRAAVRSKLGLPFPPVDLPVPAGLTMLEATELVLRQFACEEREMFLSAPGPAGAADKLREDGP